MAQAVSTVQVSLLIRTHALPPLSYRVPELLEGEIGVGTAVVAPLSGYSRLGIVVELEGDGAEDAREYLRGTARDVSLPPAMVDLCRWVAESFAMPLAAVLRAALAPGLSSSRHRVARPAAGWPWRRGSVVTRTALKRELGSSGLREAEAEGRVELVPSVPERKTVEWALINREANPALGRAPRQRELFEYLKNCGDGCQSSRLLSETGASRGVLRQLVRRGAVRLEPRPEPSPVVSTTGDDAPGVSAAFLEGARRVVRRGKVRIWRTPTGEQAAVVAATARAAVETGDQALILAPEVSIVERLVEVLQRALPSGRTIAAYHGGMGRERNAVYEAARAGELDVVVGTRTAALLSMPRLGAICVVDEPSEGHRAEPGYEGLPVHVRDIALRRASSEGAAVLLLSPFPSLRLRHPECGPAELPPRPAEKWPSVRIVDMRGSGADLSSTVLDACRNTLEAGGRAGVVVNRLGYATTVFCNSCGAVRACPRCDLPLALHGRRRLLICGRCAYREKAADECAACGSRRLSSTGLAVERVREELSHALAAPTGLLTAGESDLPEAQVVVGTPQPVLGREWDTLILPDVDYLLMGGGITAAERSFRLLYRSAEQSGRLLVIQTRHPEHYALRAAVRDDYPSFAAAERPRLYSLGYPPFAHLACLTLTGREASVRRAVESRVRPVLGPKIELSGPVPVVRAGGFPAWRVLLRSPERALVARAGALAARAIARAGGLKVQVEVDPEEV